MIDFDFKRSSRRCCVTGREFQPGESYISAVFQIDEGVLERRDYALDQWTEPPEDCVGWWQCTVPIPEEGKIYWAPRRVLISYFESLFDQPGFEDTLYVTALVLIQRKVLKLIVTERTDSGGERMIVVDTRSKKEYLVPVIDVLATRVPEIQQELAEKLFTDCLDEDDEEIDAEATDMEPEASEEQSEANEIDDEAVDDSLPNIADSGQLSDASVTLPDDSEE